MKAPTNTETRLTAEWEPEVKLKRQGASKRTLKRKVVTKGPIDIAADEILTKVIHAARRGYEPRLTYKGKDAVRFIPITDREYKTIGLKSQTMGEFVRVLSDIKVKLFKRNGGNISKRAATELAEMTECDANTYRNSLVHVTPDMTVTCPECGTEFRVGKVLK